MVAIDINAFAEANWSGYKKSVTDISKAKHSSLRRDLSRWFSAKGYQKSNGAATRHLYDSPSTI